MEFEKGGSNIFQKNPIPKMTMIRIRTPIQKFRFIKHSRLHQSHFLTEVIILEFMSLFLQV
jgi:hypothetical protein